MRCEDEESERHGGGSEKGLKNTMAERAEKVRGGAVMGHKEGRSTAAHFFRSHYLQLHAVKVLPQRPYTSICRRGAEVLT